jgi:hypothetical protein
VSGASGDIPSLHGGSLRDRDGAQVGHVEELLFEAATSRPAWLVVALAGGRRTLVPARRARATVRGLRIAVDRAVVLACPVTLGAVPAPVGPEHVVEACAHYGIRRVPGALAGSAGMAVAAPPVLWDARVGRRPQPSAPRPGITHA